MTKTTGWDKINTILKQIGHVNLFYGFAATENILVQSEPFRWPNKHSII